LYQLARELERLDVSGLLGGAVSAGRLDVLRTLSRGGPQTVSQIARGREATRQGVQRLVDALVAEGWLELAPNPRHRRARLVKLARRGEREYQRLAAEEARALNAVAEAMPAERMQEATQLLRQLRRALASRSDG
jgi:DNA-binding MarR family transcriptional regulator